MTLTVFGSAQPIYTLGESHCMALGNTLFEWRPGEVFMCRSRFLPYLKAQHYIEDGKLHPSLIEALNAERLLDEKGLPKFLDENISFAYYSGVPVMPPPMVFFTGDMDMHMTLFKEWGDAYDFILPGDETYGFDRNKKPVPLTAVCKKVEMLLSPFTSALLRLRDMGFSRLMIHCLPARSNNPKKAYWLGFDYALRAKLTIVANSYYASFCQRENIGYIDTWDETVENGYLRDELDLDGGHLVKSATLISLRKIMEYLYGNNAYAFNPGRYALALERSSPLVTIRNHHYAGKWNSVGVVEAELGRDVAEKLGDGLTFSPPEYDLDRLDWVVPVNGMRPEILVATPTTQQLEFASKLLGSGMGDDLLHTDSLGELTISGFRPVRVKAATVFSRPPAPPGVRKAIFHLKGKGTLRLTSLEGVVKDIHPKSGMLIIYDPHRMACEYLPQEEGFDSIEITAIPRIPRQPFRVIWSGLRDFPVDPFSHSIHKILAFPPFTGDRFLERGRLPVHDQELERSQAFA